jgi:hypothetical protein
MFGIKRWLQLRKSAKHGKQVASWLTESGIPYEWLSPRKFELLVPYPYHQEVIKLYFEKDLVIWGIEWFYLSDGKHMTQLDWCINPEWDTQNDIGYLDRFQEQFLTYIKKYVEPHPDIYICFNHMTKKDFIKEINKPIDKQYTYYPVSK